MTEFQIGLLIGALCMMAVLSAAFVIAAVVVGREGWNDRSSRGEM